ncbi:MAG: hypothetical protein UR85_C0011G0028 [Candidatus Nomurabacteria bacterium GW2011_GWF2_35_66]|nr:MAG: hypothetical protein UR85_C0011G0028 [Candidatus Nomurabacteria bacterium GW2011_GWF2_35_66]HBM45434.1 hypothetical protein [Patescibacteria group bacterium]
MKVRTINILLLVILSLFVIFTIFEKYLNEVEKRGTVATIDGVSIDVSKTETPVAKGECDVREIIKNVICAVVDRRTGQLLVYLPGVYPVPCYEMSRIKNLVIFTNTPKGQPTSIITWVYAGESNYETIEIHLHSKGEVYIKN